MRCGVQLTIRCPRTKALRERRQTVPPNLGAPNPEYLPNFPTLDSGTIRCPSKNATHKPHQNKSHLNVKMALTSSNLEGTLKLLNKGKVRDVYQLSEDEILFVATDRISAYDVIMENVRSIESRPRPRLGSASRLEPRLTTERRESRARESFSLASLNIGSPKFSRMFAQITSSRPPCPSLSAASRISSREGRWL